MIIIVLILVIITLFFFNRENVFVHARLLQSCLTLCNPMDCSLPASSDHGTLQARILECYALWSHHFMGNRWGNSGNSVRFYFFGSKITADGDCSHEIKRRLLLGRKVISNLDSILKSRDITLPTMVRLVKAMVFPVVMYGCESWTVKKAEHRRIDAFELWCWRRLIRVPWTARRSNQSILKEISPGISLEEIMLKWKLQYFGHLM